MSPRETVSGVLVRTVGYPFQVDDKIHLSNDLNIRDERSLELFMALECACRIDFTAEEMATHSTVGALIALVEEKVRGDG